MTIEALIDHEVMRHLSLYGTIKRMDPFAQHILKTSQKPIMRFRRDWMRREALRQCLEATRDQSTLNESVAKTSPRKGSSARLNASVHPYFAGSMRERDKADWNDKDYLKFVKREEPSIFPRREPA
jgi:hypothetical protein